MAGCSGSRMPFVLPANVSDWPLNISNNETHESLLCMWFQSLFSYFCSVERCVWELFLQCLSVPAVQVQVQVLWPLIRTEMVHIQHLSQVLNAELKRDFLGGKKQLKNWEKVFWSNSCLFRHWISKLPHASHLKILLSVSKIPVAPNYLMLGDNVLFCACFVPKMQWDTQVPLILLSCGVSI